MRWCIKRSILCFWELFLERCEGEEEQVPRLRQDFTQECWEAVGRVWWKGYLDLSIIPIQLSPAFVRACYPRISSVDDELLMKSFSRFISGPKWMAVKKGLHNNMDETAKLSGPFFFLPSRDHLRTSLLIMAQCSSSGAKVFNRLFFTPLSTMWWHPLLKKTI